MTTTLSRNEEFLRLVDAGSGLVDRKIFSDQDIYDLEMERIFARAWNFMAHDSQVPNPGDFFMTYIGEDRVIVVRDKSGRPQVLLNTCRHRGNAVCRAEEGHATSFMCTYHGWTYDLQGKLVGVPGFKDYYHEDLDREAWGLVAAAHVDTYKGFIFATLDPEAPSLEDFLGDVGRIGIDLIAARGDNLKVVPGIQKYTIGCNWKLSVDNLFDYYHVAISHASSTMANWNRRRSAPAPSRALGGLNFSQHLVLLGEFGHAIGGPQVPDESKTSPEEIARQAALGLDESWRKRPEAKDALGPIGLKSRGHPNIFPNMWITESAQISMRMPRGPHATEMWWFTIVDGDKDPVEQSDQVFRMNHVFGPAGMLEQEDGENWDQSTRGTMGTVARRYPLNFAMALGRGEIIEDELGPPRIETHINEHAQLWTYRAWAEWMAAESWQDLKANHSASPSGLV